ncbi:MAG: SIS domain-containing protein [Clostridia bacterium]|nr:SIS domain-containing protein [Clostridia bacterium]
MKDSTYNFLEKLIARYPDLECVKGDIEKTYLILEETYKNKGKVLVCGNGGSAADCEHIVGELMKGFLLPRKLSKAEAEAFSAYNNGEYVARGIQKGLPAISLVSQSGLMTAFLNDCSPDLVFAQQVYTYMNENDTLIALSTSGNSANVLNGVVTTKAKGGKCVALTGARDSKISAIADSIIKLPSEETYIIQEYTLPVYHCICAMLEEEFFGE